MRHFIVIACIAFAATSASATPRSSTTINHFAIAGLTPAEILDSLHQRGPNVQGVSAYAATRIEFVSKPVTYKSGNSCKVKNFDFAMKFTMNLPKHSDANSLTARTASAWNKFNGFIKKHEETHKKIWLSCSRSYEDAIRNLAGKQCQAAQAKAANLMAQMKSNCNYQHEAFDAAERNAMKRHPFVQMVLAGR